MRAELIAARDLVQLHAALTPVLSDGGDRAAHAFDLGFFDEICELPQTERPIRGEQQALHDRLQARRSAIGRAGIGRHQLRHQLRRQGPSLALLAAEVEAMIVRAAFVERGLHLGSRDRRRGGRRHAQRRARGVVVGELGNRRVGVLELATRARERVFELFERAPGTRGRARELRHGFGRFGERDFCGRGLVRGGGLRRCVVATAFAFLRHPPYSSPFFAMISACARRSAAARVT